jgi:ubiquinone/menaquinone biosynthesis C-methylase UbiE
MLSHYFKKLLIFNITLHSLPAVIYSYGLSYARYVEYAVALQYLALKKEGGIVVDIGSGKSLLPLAIRQFLRKDVVCIDVSKKALIEQRKMGLNCIRASGTFLPFRENSIDFVTSISVIEHIPYDGDLLTAREIGRVIKQMAIISIPFSKIPKSISDNFYGIPKIFRFFKPIIRGFFLVAHLDRKGFTQRYYNLKRLHKIATASSMRPEFFFFGSKISKILYRLLPIGVITFLEYLVALSLKPNHEDFVILILRK